MASAFQACLCFFLAGIVQGSLVLRDAKHEISPSRFSVIHSPSYVHFASDAGALPVKEVGAMSAYALGLAPGRGLTWNGLMPGSLFRRPKANVMFVVDGVPSGKTLGLKSQVQIPMVEDHNDPHHAMHAVTSFTNLASHVSNLFHGKSLAFSLAGRRQAAEEANAKETASSMFWDAEKKVFTAVSSLKDSPFQSLAVSKLAEQLKTFSWPKGTQFTGSAVEVMLKDGAKAVLDMSHQADGEFLAELAATLAAPTFLSAKSALVADNVPDVLTFTLSGLKTLQLRYGSSSPQIEAALTVLRAVLSYAAKEFANLYHGDAIVELVELTFDDHLYQKHSLAIETLFQHLQSHLRKQTLPEILSDLPRLHLSDSASRHADVVCDKAKRHLSALKAVVTIECPHHRPEEVMPRSGRHLLWSEGMEINKGNVTKLNLAFERGADWTATFTMVLLLLIILILSLLAICYVLWNMDPGYDSIIYRMTNQRIKME